METVNMQLAVRQQRLTVLDNPLQGITWNRSHHTALLSLLSNRNVLSQDADVQLQPSVCDTQSTVNRGQQERDKRKLQLPGGQGKYNFTEDFQRHQLDEVDRFKPVKERLVSPVREK